VTQFPTGEHYALLLLLFLLLLLLFVGLLGTVYWSLRALGHLGLAVGVWGTWGLGDLESGALGF
jgi:hypothetical protein